MTMFDAHPMIAETSVVQPQENFMYPCTWKHNAELMSGCLVDNQVEIHVCMANGSFSVACCKLQSCIGSLVLASLMNLSCLNPKLYGM